VTPSAALASFAFLCKRKMSERVKRVTLVLDPDYGDKLSLLAEVSHVWVIDTPANRTAASIYWSQNPKSDTEQGITTFKSFENEAGAESCLKMLDTIDLHHGKYSSHPPYSVFEVIGSPLTKPIKSALEGLGFTTFEAMAEGFRARR
jgi:hypothetical protein